MPTESARFTSDLARLAQEEPTGKTWESESDRIAREASEADERMRVKELEFKAVEGARLVGAARGQKFGSHEEANRAPLMPRAGGGGLPKPSVAEALAREIEGAPTKIDHVAEQTSNGVSVMETHVKEQIAAMRSTLDELELELVTHCSKVRSQVRVGVEMSNRIMGSLGAMQETIKNVRAIAAKPVN